MESITVVIADDSNTSRAVLYEMLACMEDFQIVGEAEDGEQLVKLTMEKRPQLIVTDVDMPKLSGLTAYKRCQKFIPELKAIFISGFENFAAKAFDVSAVDYVVKPVSMSRLLQALDRAKTGLAAENQKGQAGMGDRLIVKTEGKVYFLSSKEILFIEKVGRHAVIHTTTEIFNVQCPLHQLLSQLPYSFVLAHRSYIINMDHVSSITPSGNTYMAYFRNYSSPAHISKHKYNEILKMAEAHQVK